METPMKTNAAPGEAGRDPSQSRRRSQAAILLDGKVSTLVKVAYEAPS